MRLWLVAAVAAAVPGWAAAQPSAAEKAATVGYVLSLYDKETGAFRVEPKGPPGLRAVNGAAKALKLFGGHLPDEKKTQAFVLSCYDPKTGAFSEPGGKPDVTITAVGVMAAVEVGIPEERFPDAVEYLHKTARTFEEVRIGAAALEAVNERPKWLPEWFAVADKLVRDDGTAGEGDGIVRETASVIAMKLRLGFPEKQLVNSAKLDDVLQAGQRPDGGYGKAGTEASDLESTYRVMRAFTLMKEQPKGRREMRQFVAKCRNPDGGYGVKPGDPSTMSGAYYAAVITTWLDEMGD